jgi:hypothetical protein
LAVAILENHGWLSHRRKSREVASSIANVAGASSSPTARLDPRRRQWLRLRSRIELLHDRAHRPKDRRQRPALLRELAPSVVNEGAGFFVGKFGLGHATNMGSGGVRYDAAPGELFPTHTPARAQPHQLSYALRGLSFGKSASALRCLRVVGVRQNLPLASAQPLVFVRAVEHL